MMREIGRWREEWDVVGQDGIVRWDECLIRGLDGGLKYQGTRVKICVRDQRWQGRSEREKARTEERVFEATRMRVRRFGSGLLVNLAWIRNR
jgi:hypothetical protein